MSGGTLFFFIILDRLELNQTPTEFTISFLIVQFILAAVMAVIFKAQITDPMIDVRSHITRMAEGDMSRTMDRSTGGTGETKALVNATNVLSRSVSTLIGKVKNSAYELGQAAEELAAGSEEVAATTEEVTSTIQTIAEGAAEQVRRLEEVSSILTEMVEVTEDSIRQIGITSRITLDLAEQTNLVSLNAAIEAAKASGESEGFQVVADHVRQLSVESKSASNTVNQITRRISNRMRESVDKIVSAVDKIASVAENTAASSEEAAAAAEEQSAALQEITQQAQKLAELSDTTEANIGVFRIS